MDKILDRNTSKSEVIGLCGRDEKKNDHAEPTKESQDEGTKVLQMYLHNVFHLLQPGIPLDKYI